MELSPKPVGTAYKKIVPSAELPNIQIRDSFWQKDQVGWHQGRGGKGSKEMASFLCRKQLDWAPYDPGSLLQVC